MEAIYEAEAGRLLMFTHRVLSDKLTLELAMRFRTVLNRFAVYDRLSDDDKRRVNLAMAAVRSEYMLTTALTRSLVTCRRISG